MLHYDGDIRLHKVPMGRWGNNGYVVVCPETNQSIVVDAPEEPEKLLAAARSTRVKAILITHTHADHIAGLDALREALQAPVGVHAADAPRLSRPPDLLLQDGDTVTAGTIELRVLHTPGHTPGAVCFHTGQHLFSGDTLFPGGPGRTRTPEDLHEIVRQITSRLLALPPETVVYPGHGEDTTIGVAREEHRAFAARPHPPDLCGDVLWLAS